MKKDTRLKRLKELKKMLENHHKLFKTVKFDIDYFAISKDEAQFVSKTCDTAACALGSAGLYAPFVKEGLKTDKKEGDVYFKVYSAYDAGAEFFGLTLAESEYLFQPTQYSDEYGADFNAITESYRHRPLKRCSDVKLHHVGKRVDNLIHKYQAE